VARVAEARPGPKRGGGAVLALGVAVVLGAGGASAAGGAASATSASSGTSANGRARAANQNSKIAESRLVRRGIRVDQKFSDDNSDCVAHSYGQVRDFFRSHSCVALQRAHFQVRDRRGDVVLIAVSRVEMTDETDARALQRLLDTHGTGNVLELSREQGRYRTVRYTGDFYASRRDGTVVSNAQAQPVARGASGLALTSIVTDLAR
jgi:hypothetical protein